MGRIGGDAGSGGDGICGNRDDNGVSGNGGGIGIAKNLLTSSLVKDSVGKWGLKDILAVTRSAGGCGIKSAKAGCSSSSSSSFSSCSSSSSSESSSKGSSSSSSSSCGNGCSLAGKTSSSGGIYSGYTGSDT
uniref:Uncharacterized protein n=1 Tax=Tanacetum cinerariifolium TaxID=118510 RepID=A0A699RSS7_TANCI|nr:hypothetical protein [Tanacetum cinerariifolium]